MNKIIYFLFFVAAVTIIASCGGKKEDKSNSEEYVANETAVKEESAGDAVAVGEGLVKKSDCKTCHHKTNKIIGPAHLDVAKKYDFTAANVSMLADKIIKGGSGVWGESPMNPHPDITKDDAEKMARYVLSLDGEKEH